MDREIRDLERVAALLDEVERVLDARASSELSPYSLSARRRDMREDVKHARLRCRELLHHLHFRERAALQQKAAHAASPS